MLTPAQPRPLGGTLLVGIAATGFALVGAVVLYFATEGLMLLLLWAESVH